MRERTALLVVNAHSRRGADEAAAIATELRESGLRLREELVTAGRRPVGEIIAEHSAAVDLIVVGGGDGTLNASADAVVRAGLPFGIVPMGTGNDLARTLMIPSDLHEACQVIIHGRTAPIDLGCINGKYFFNVASLGLSVEVARLLTREVKRRWGVLGYLISLWRAAQANRSFRVRVRCDAEEQIALRSIQLGIGNGRHYGGGLTIAAEAAIDDGMLDLISMAPEKLWRLLLGAPAFSLGLHGDVDRVRHWRAREVEISTSRPMPINTDGEVTTTTPARAWVVPKALTVFVPEAFLTRQGGHHAEG